MNAIDSTYDSNGNLVIICDDDTRITVGDCSPSNRVFHGSISGSQEGEEYVDEQIAYGKDQGGNRYLVTWQFDQVKGEEEEEDRLPWYDVEHITRLECLD